MLENNFTDMIVQNFKESKANSRMALCNKSFLKNKSHPQKENHHMKEFHYIKT